jgi:endonuclease/exonuclease/phosphatase family metal-dependent hydrolase
MYKIVRIFRILFENIFINYKNYDKNFKLETNDTLVSFNIRADHPRDNKNNWVHRRNAIIDFIKDKKPSIICMQEPHSHMFKWLYKKIFNQYDCIEIARNKNNTSLLKNLNWFCTSLVTWYDKTKYTLGDYKIIHQTGGKTRNDSAFALWCVLYDKNNNPYNIINTHYNTYSNEDRNKLTDSVNNFIISNNFNNIYFCGDFNASITSSELKNIKLPYHIPFDNDTQRTFNHFDNTHAIIDFIFSDRKIDDYEIITDGYGVEYISDHYPIKIEL